MSQIALSSNSWAELERDDARFQRTLSIVALPFIILGILIPLYELTGLQEGGGEELSQRYAELLIQSVKEQQAEEPAPPVIEEPVVEDEPEPEAEAEPEAEPEPESSEPEPETKPEPKPEPEPQVDQRVEARKKVKKKFASAFNALDDLRQAPVISAQSNKPLQQAASVEATETTNSGVITSGLSRGSGGVSNAPRRSSQPSSTGLSGRQSTQLESQIAASGGGLGPQDDKQGFGGDSKMQGRSLEEIQIVMDRNKSGLYSLYNRALRKDPTLQGKVVLEITIAPSGEVVDCNIVSSELRNEALEKRIVRRVKLIDFGSKNVSEMTIKYPIHFIPS